LNPTLGQIVYSKAGRDSGKALVISGILNEFYVFVADGNIRRIEKPKKKKIKHLKLTDEIIEQIADKLKNSIRVNNAELRKAMEIFANKNESTIER
jgi:large subunit ribosomal protein L14e